MKEWKEICDIQAAGLRKSLELKEAACALAQAATFVQGENALLARLEKDSQAIHDRLRRLDDGLFRIGVVGAENTGKSSFINAWVDYDILPNDSDRCTYTTTILHSVNRIEDQRLEVRMRSRADFDAMLADLESAIAKDPTSQNQRRDRDLIRKYEREMRSLLDTRLEPIKFTTLEDIKVDLRKYAADERYAFAVEQVHLYTTGIAELEGIVFYDLPGVDSGLTKHLEDTRAMLGICDAVIMVKKLEDPRFKGHEEDILRLAQSQAGGAEFKDTLFIYYSNIDKFASRSAFEEDREKALKFCQAQGIDLGKTRFGVAPAGLALSGKFRDQIHIFEDREEFKEKLRSYLDLPDARDETIIAHAGIKTMKDRMNTYLRNEREGVLRGICNELNAKIDRSAHDLYNRIMATLPDTPAKMEEQRRQELLKAREDWFEKRWQEIRGEMNKEDVSTLISDCAKSMETSYVEQARICLTQLESFNEKNQDEILSSLSTDYGAELYQEFNSGLRKQINAELITKLHELSELISLNLFNALTTYMTRLGNYFYDVIDVRSQLLKTMNALPEENYQRHLESAMSALYLRYARPLARGLIQYRHGTPARKNILEGNRRVLEHLFLYMPENETQADLLHLAGRKENQPQTATKQGQKKVEQEPVLEERAPVYNSRAEVLAELESDRQKLEKFLVEAIFECSGMEGYAEAELERIKRTFIHNRNIWKSGIDVAYERGDEKLMAELPEHLRDNRFDDSVPRALERLSRLLFGQRTDASREEA